MRMFFFIISLAIIPGIVAGEIREAIDAPYVFIAKDGSLEVWIPSEKGSEVTKRVHAIRIGERISVSAVGNRPAFDVPIRPRAEIGPDNSNWPKEAPVFLIADTHGEYEIATELLMQQKVIDASLKWAFGAGHLVVLGDVFDRGPRQTELIWLFYKLEAEAIAAGGRVWFLLGNHEIMALTGNSAYQNPRYNQVYQSMMVGRLSELWGPDALLGQWLRTKPSILRLGSLLCLHGGISRDAVIGKYTISEINESVRDLLNDDENIDQNRLSFIAGRYGPLWYRGLVQREASAEQIEQAKAFYDIRRIAVGHTIVPSIAALYGGDVIAVQVYPTKDKATGKMNMEGVYIDDKGFWYKAGIDGLREILRNEKGDPIRNEPSTLMQGQRDSKLDNRDLDTGFSEMPKQLRAA